MVILVKVYRVRWFPIRVGRVQWRVGPLTEDCQQWVVISNWELTKVEDYVNG